jgi:tRNA-specific 2-thiouridylase
VQHPFEQHLTEPRGQGDVPPGAHVGSAGGAACGDVVRLAVRVEDGRLTEVTFDAEGCGATVAAGSACVSLAEDRPLLEAARVSAGSIDAELGGLSPGKRHAADLAADALHRALSRAAAVEERLALPSLRRVVVGLSGGVDSAAAALLCLREGLEVVAVTLKLWADQEGDGERSCCSPQAVIGARALAHSIGLPHLTLDMEDRFRATVVDDYLAEHAAGRTPNPCVRCNGLVRFDAMLKLADRLGARTLATGHYARIARDGDGPLVARAADPRKDQSYMLAGLSPSSLDRLRFPLGRLTKPEVREIARQAGLAVAGKRESQDLCFLAGTNRERFLARHARLREEPGDVVDSDGRVLGRHRGYRRFTVGQRKGVGVAAGSPLYVLATDASRNRVVVGPRHQLAARRVEVRGVELHRAPARVDSVKLRYRSEPVSCRVEYDFSGAVTLLLDEPASGVAPGQTACLMERDRVIGYGTIAASAPALRGHAHAAARAT